MFFSCLHLKTKQCYRWKTIGTISSYCNLTYKSIATVQSSQYYTRKITSTVPFSSTYNGLFLLMSRLSDFFVLTKHKPHCSIYDTEFSKSMNLLQTNKNMGPLTCLFLQRNVYQVAMLCKFGFPYYY